MPKCGSQIFLCNLPIRFDTYQGCSHACQYCFVFRKYPISKIKPFESGTSLKKFINGERTDETLWCDWDIPLHWGGVSDPFQPIELKYGISKDCLRIFADTGYPFVVSSKSILPIRDDYFELLSKCNFVYQMSMLSTEYDTLETGAPSFIERLNAVEKISKYAKRVIIRLQPYLTSYHNSILSNIKNFKAAGAYGVVVEAIKFQKKLPSLVRIGADFLYPKKLLQFKFREIKRECRKNSLKFYVGENRLRNMGDSLTCCGCDDLPGYKVNKANLNQYLFKPDEFEFTGKMNEKGTAEPFGALAQNTVKNTAIYEMSYEELMMICTKDKTKMKAFLGAAI